MLSPLQNIDRRGSCPNTNQRNHFNNLYYSTFRLHELNAMRFHRICFLILPILISFEISSQTSDWAPERTEVWKPVPAIVTPGSNNSPPSDAIPLFHGKNFSEWEHSNGDPVQWLLKDGTMIVKKSTGGIQTKRAFGDCQLHLEWKTPEVIEGEGQGRGNSGIYFQSLYEVQVLDSYENVTYPNGQAGSIYKQHIPLVNASLAPGQWQTYDIIFKAPVFNSNGTLKSPAFLTVIHNGVLVQNHVEIRGPTVYQGLPKYVPHPAKMSLYLQDHGNPVSYRNIWIREL